LLLSADSSIEDAVGNAITRASRKLRNIRWFEIVEIRGQIEDDKVSRYQVTLKVGFTLDESGSWAEEISLL